MDKTIGFIGLGTMGNPMAWNIHNKGFTLGVYNRTAEKMKPFTEKGIPGYATPEELANHAEIIIIMVSDPAAVRQILLSETGVLSGMRPGTRVINMSTISHQVTMKSAEIVQKHGGTYLDVPVSGTKKPAKEGTLVILAGGEKPVVDEVTPVLETMGKKIIYCGEIGQATNMKLAINLLLASMMQGLVESLGFAKKLGIEPEAFMHTVESGGLNAPFLTAKSNLIRNGDFDINFPLRLMMKDLNLVLDSAGENGIPLPQTAATREMFNAAMAAGYGDEDMAAVVKVIENLAGVDLRG